MKEFHLIYAVAKNKQQFAQLCQDAMFEMNVEKRPRLASMELFKKYYNLNFSLLQLQRLAKFIQKGDFVQEFACYN